MLDEKKSCLIVCFHFEKGLISPGVISMAFLFAFGRLFQHQLLTLQCISFSESESESESSRVL